MCACVSYAYKQLKAQGEWAQVSRAHNLADHTCFAFRGRGA